MSGNPFHLSKPPNHQRGGVVSWAILLMVIIGIAGSAYGIVTSPKLRAKLPYKLQEKVLRTEHMVQKMTHGDVVVLSKSIGAKKLLKKEDKAIPYKSGTVGFRQAKTYRMSDHLKATIQVERLPTSAKAQGVLLAKGGTAEDQLYIGYPSFFETHGLDKKDDYFLKTHTRSGAYVISVKIMKELSQREKRSALGPAYEKVMNRYATKMVDRAIAMTQAQIRRIDSFAIK